MKKRFFSVLLSIALLGNTGVFAQLTEEDGVFREDFEAYETAAEIMGDKTLIKEFTRFEPEVGENDGSSVMVVNSASGADNIIYTNARVFSNELNVMKFKLGADTSSKLNWGSTSALVFSHANEAGIFVNDYILDFAYSLVRHKENGVTEKSICGFSSKKMYNMEVSAVKTSRDGKYYYDVTYVVDGNQNKVSFPTNENGEMRIGFKSTGGNRLYVDDIVTYGFTLVKATANITGRSDVSVKPEIEVTFSDEVAESSFVLDDMSVGNVGVEKIEPSGENKYIITLSSPLKKNTEYTLDISAIRDLKGNQIENGKFTFTTKNTAVILEDMNLINTSAKDSENIVIAMPKYDENGTMISNSVIPIEIYPEEEIPMWDDGCIILTDDYKPIAAAAYRENTGKISDEYVAEFDTATQKLSISGKTTTGYENEEVAIRVTDKNGTVDYLSTVKTGENGYFSVEYTPASASGAYTVQAKTMQEEFSDVVNVRLEADIKSLFDVIKAENAQDISAALTSFDEMLAIDLDLYTNIEDKSFIVSEIIKAEEYKTIEKLIEDIKVFTLIDTIRAMDDKVATFDAYEEILLASDDAAYEVWSALSVADKDAVLDEVIARGKYEPNALKADIYTESILAMTLRSNKYIEVKNAIEKYSELLGLDLTDYNNAKQPTSVAKGLCGKEWTKAGFKEEFDRLVEVAIKEASKPSSPGGGGGGGGGGGAVLSGNIASTKATPEPMNTPVPTAEPTAEPVSFNDMENTKWAEEAVNSLCERKILNGYEDGTFRPDGNITREEFVAVIVRYLGLDKKAQSSFNDVSENDWFADYVSSAYAHGIVKGVSETSFGVGQTITRQDAAVILYNMGAEADGEVQFTDADEISDYAKEAVRVLSCMEIISGNPDGSFNPKGALTRAQAAKLIYSYDMKREDVK